MVSALRVVAMVAQVSTSMERRATEGELVLGRTAKRVFSYLLWTAASRGMVFRRWQRLQWSQPLDGGDLINPGNLLLPMEFRSTFKRPWRSGREPGYSFIHCLL